MQTVRVYPLKDLDRLTRARLKAAQMEVARVWMYCVGRRCGFRGHRDIVGSMNMHLLAFGSRISYPASLTYRRPVPLRDRRLDKELSPSGTS